LALNAVRYDFVAASQWRSPINMQQIERRRHAGGAFGALAEIGWDSLAVMMKLDLPT
jgi:hypothetical protein